MPASILSNKDLEALVETADDWIATRTGIRRRRVMSANESLSSHAAAAATSAMQMAGLDAADVDIVLLATSTPDDLFGSACQVSTMFPEASEDPLMYPHVYQSAYQALCPWNVPAHLSRMHVRAFDIHLFNGDNRLAHSYQGEIVPQHTATSCTCVQITVRKRRSLSTSFKLLHSSIHPNSTIRTQLARAF